jgi:hypothetical protein
MDCGMANWTDDPSARAGAKVCLACGGPIEETLLWVASLRCLECRDIHRPLDPSLAEAPEKTAGPFMTPTALLAQLRARASRRVGS